MEESISILEQLGRLNLISLVTDLLWIIPLGYLLYFFYKEFYTKKYSEYSVPGYEEKRSFMGFWMKKKEYGELLYDIPQKMLLEERQKVIVRISSQENNIKILEKKFKVKQNIRIGEVMKVELIDLSGDKFFQIMDVNSKEQIIEKTEYTEWVFIVIPKKEGKTNIALRVSVKERGEFKDVGIVEQEVIIREGFDETINLLKLKCNRKSENFKFNQMINVFFSYSFEDKLSIEKLRKHFLILERSALIKTFSFFEVEPGKDFKFELRNVMNDSDLILLFLSPDYLASNECYENQVLVAIRKNNDGDSLTIPILLKPCLWEETPLRTLRPLPKNEKPISMWIDESEVHYQVVKEIMQITKKLIKVN